MSYDRDDLSWLQTLIRTVEQLANWAELAAGEPDQVAYERLVSKMTHELTEDPQAVAEMLRDVQALHDRLLAPILAIADWPEAVGFVCRNCGDVARQNPQDSSLWGCARCGGETHSVALNFEPTAGPQPPDPSVPF